MNSKKEERCWNSSRQQQGPLAAGARVVLPRADFPVESVVVSIGAVHAALLSPPTERECHKAQPDQAAG